MYRVGLFGHNRGNLLDLAGLMLLALAALILAALTLAGFSFAARALPFAVGALVGDGLVYLAILRPSWRKPAVLVTGLMLLVVISGWLLSFAAAYPDTWLFWEPSDLAWKFAFGFLLGFGGLVLERALTPTLFGPTTWEEVLEQRRDAVRLTSTIGGIFLALLVMASLIFGILALIAYAVGTFIG